jgi:carbonic anhydrase/acetyltransferase-like protein (isoleucine patch superfamily)
MVGRMLIAFRDVVPVIDPTAYIHSSAHVIGDVHVGAHSSVWFHAVVRGDVHHIRIGARTNIQDNATVHVTRERHPTIVGDDVTVGHNAVLHGCAVGHRCLIGIGAIVLDRCVIGEDCLIGAGALLTPGTTVAPGHLVIGSPARIARPLSDAEREHLRESAAGYVTNAARYRAQGIA